MKGILFSFFIIAASVYAQISPGDLTKFHADLEGLSNCTKCHNLGEQLTNTNCLNCHKEIKERIDQNSGYHSSGDVKGKNCWSCHSEHNGRNFEIIHFDKSQFDHSKTKFDLTGSHTKLECNKCHKSDLIKDAELKKRENTYLGLGNSCADCHEDIHQSTLGKNCNTCHNTDKFKPASGFNHNKASYKLTGAHQQVLCEKCHLNETRNGKQFTKFKGLAFQQCSDCHKDVHNGKFGNTCTKCHNTSSFRSIDRSSFDHDKTNFPLIGLHVNVNCAKCHGNNLTSKPKHQKCIDCHEDFHKGEFVVNNVPRDCKECHTEKGFTPSLFTVDRHNKTIFALTGGHLAIACKSCHNDNDKWKFSSIGTTCISCHNNIHGKEIKQTFMGDNECRGCHNTETWNKVKFDHSKTEFPLSGKHAQINCNQCHLKEGTGKREFLFLSLDTRCEACHKDIHNSQFAINGKTDCERCHSFEKWKPVKFDHTKTKFPLIGAHQSVACEKCHKQVTENNITFVKYKIEDFKCADCHLQ